jgi:hypothetical protein
VPVVVVDPLPLISPATSKSSEKVLPLLSRRGTYYKPVRIVCVWGGGGTMEEGGGGGQGRTCVCVFITARTRTPRASRYV